MYEIIDENGTIHSSKDFDEMKLAFVCMTCDASFIKEMGYAENKKEALLLQKEYYTSWEGDLKLVKIINIYK
jgi:hypothetical protein